MALDHVLSPITINRLEIKNRVTRTAHGTNMGDGALSDDLIAYHEARARGGVGLSMTEASSVHPTGPMTLHAWDDAIIPRYELLMKAVVPHGMRMFSQINHMGMYQAAPWMRPWSASEIPLPQLGMVSRAMTKGEIDEAVDAFAQAARRAQEGGLHGVEIHAAHNFLIQQFICETTNHRDDDYGGSFENRMRFFLEVLHAVRGMVGPDFIVGARVGPHNFPGGLNVDEHIDIVNRVLKEGIIDYLNVSHGSSNNGHKIIGGMHEDTGYELPFSVPLTKLTDIPTIVTGRFRTLEDAERVIASGMADMVGMTRAHIADPDLVKKTVAGRADEVRPCIGCNQGCLGGLFEGQMGCTVNVAVGHELRLGDDRLEPAAAPRKVLVVGGGPAGMEAARVAALRGHRVTLVEASASLGGTLRVARLAPKHESIGDVADWLEAEMDRRGITVLLETRATPEMIREVEPDVVILATGASPRVDGRIAARPDLKVEGVDQDHVVSTQQLLTGRHNQIGDTALVLDDAGVYEAIGAAEFLVDQGAHVTFVTTQPAFAPKVLPNMATPALERLNRDGRFKLVTRAYVEKVTEDEVVIGSLDGWPSQSVPAETVVLVTENTPNNDLAGHLAAAGVPIHVVGDAGGPEYLPAAFAQGNLAGRSV
ncbi:MAG: FAD-dependent oxidoreductase [Alphaproteobacteria bacterium]